ncbi:MAG: ribose-phosphate pyrophosphokinase [Nanoarchaeota archaeon]|nr:ribose-phosphate pyrophosphokinase [Nanoarchaeota archaeon]MBU1027847.1 ribose-phosphate pyrophosphokinase [Nanoarchaeota archaeon]
MNNTVFLADKNSKAWNFAKKIQTYVLETKEFLIPLHEVSITKFRNGEVEMYIPENMRGKDVYFIQDSTKYPQDWWVELLLIKDLLLNSSAESVTFVIPNMLYSRQDRKNRPHVPISARALAKSISPGLKKIITLDLHAGQIQGFYPENVPVDNLYSFPEVVRSLRRYHLEDLDNLVVVAPDAGAAGRTRYFLQRLEKAQQDTLKKQNYSFAVFSKERAAPGEVASMQLIGDVNEKNCLIVDDIIDSGGTLCKAAQILKENGAKKIMCYGTHGIFTKGISDLCDNYDFVMTSNTYPQENSLIEVIDVAPLFAEAIYRAQRGLSISKLFE